LFAGDCGILCCRRNLCAASEQLWWFALVVVILAPIVFVAITVEWVEFWWFALVVAIVFCTVTVVFVASTLVFIGFGVKLWLWFKLWQWFAQFWLVVRNSAAFNCLAKCGGKRFFKKLRYSAPRELWRADVFLSW
jgi:hypothetical protein